MDFDNMSTADKIKYYLFTMSEDELMDVLKLIEEYLASGEE